MTTIDTQPSVLLTGIDEFVEARRAEPAWRRAVRTRALDRYREEGLPTTRDEEWLYTPITAIVDANPPLATGGQATPADIAPFRFDDFHGPQVVFVDGRFAPDLSDLRELPAGARLATIAQLLDAGDPALEAHFGRAIQVRQRGFTALNEAWNTDGAVIFVDDDVEVTTPVHVIYYSTGAGASYPRTLIVVGRHARIPVVETFAGAERRYFVNAVTELVADEGGHVDHYKVQRESVAAHHVASMHLHLAATADVATHNITLGGALTRNDINATLAGEGIECTVNGLYLVDGDRLVDNHTAIDHASPRCHSFEIYKGVLNDRGRGVFNGKIFVRQDAQKTDAKQTNKALLLTDEAQINTKPQLEIFADDVKCTHGAAIGQLDEDAMFYLKARGINALDARNMLIHAFADDVLNGIRLESVRKTTMTLVEQMLDLPA